MLIEATVKKPITYRHPGGEILIEPGPSSGIPARREANGEKAGSRVGVVQLF